MKRKIPLPLLLLFLGGTILPGCEPESTDVFEASAIRVDSMATMGAEEEGYLSSTVLSVSFLLDGQIGVFDWNAPGYVQVYAQDGTFLRTLGQRGEGPGEYGQPRSILGSASTGRHYVIDPQLGRITVYEGLDSPATSTFRIPVHSVVDAAILPGDTMVLAGTGHTEVSAGSPLHRFGPEGRYLGSFGAAEATLGDLETGTFVRSLAVADGGGLWSAHRDAYRVEKWSPTGELERTYDWSGPWFPTDQEPNFAPAAPDGPPPSSFVSDIMEDEAGRLWILANVPAANWGDLLELELGEDGVERYRRPTPARKLWHTRIEVRDAETGELILADVVPIALQGMSSGGLAWSVDALDGMPVVRLWRLTLTPGDR